MNGLWLVHDTITSLEERLASCLHNWCLVVQMLLLSMLLLLLLLLLLCCCCGIVLFLE